jgi:hypothetical protein
MLTLAEYVEDPTVRSLGPDSGSRSRVASEFPVFSNLDMENTVRS